MELTPIYRRVIGLDVHQAKISACALIEHEDGRCEVIRREFGAFKRDRRALALWAQEVAPQVVVMESTGVYWKSPHSALEAVGIAAWVVNARHVKAVPGRKTDVADAQVHIQPPGIRKQAPLLRQRCTPDALRNNLLEGPCF